MKAKRVVCRQCHNACLEHRQVAAFRAKRPDPIAQVQPQTARPLGIVDERVVHVEHGRWFPETAGAGSYLHGVWTSNCNVLTDDDPDICNPISGGYPLRGMLCRVKSR